MNKYILSLGLLGLVLSGVNDLAETANSNPFLRDKSTASSNYNGEKVDKALMIVLDCSGSMAEKAEDGNTKLFAAKKTLENVLREVDNQAYIGLRVYGSSPLAHDSYSRCQDTRLLVSPGLNNRQTLVNKLRGIKPSGVTPISLAVKRAIKDMDNIDAKEKSIILISDGIDTCGYDPCTLAVNLKNSNVNVKFNVVGFGISDDLNALNQLECMAKVSDGKFYTADNSSELSESLMDGIEDFKKVVTGSIQELKH